MPGEQALALVEEDLGREVALLMELAGREVAAAIQLGIEYDPAPPVDAGDPTQVPAPQRALDSCRAR